MFEGRCADFDGDMPSFTPIEFTLTAYTTKRYRKVKRGPGRGRKVRIKVIVSRKKVNVVDPLHRYG